MALGIDVFRDYFSEYKDQYVLESFVIVRAIIIHAQKNEKIWYFME